MKFNDAPAHVTICGERCPKYNCIGQAYYSLDSWPFKFSVTSGETMWRWELTGLGGKWSGATSSDVNSFTDGANEEALKTAVEEMQVRAGDAIRKLLAFQKYGDPDET